MKFASTLVFIGLFLQSFGQISILDAVEIKENYLNDDFSKRTNYSELFKLNNIKFLSFLGKKSDSFHEEKLLSLGAIFPSNNRSVIPIRIPVDRISEFLQTHEFESLSIAKTIDYQLDKALIDTRADSVHLGIDLPQSYSGKNVYIGVTDWGFDYSSPMFYDTSLSDTRIVAAWDQYKQSGPPPSGFSYGTEYNNASDLLLAGSDTSNIYSYATHGTHVAGIAGGSGAGTVYKGIAFDAKFLFCTFLVDEAAVLDAWEWMYQKALNDGKRLVVNMSWGLYHMGTLDGSSLLSQAISQYTDLGVVFVNSGGNNGNVNFHIQKNFTPDDSLLKSKIDFYSYAANPNMWGQSIHAWGEPGKEFSIGFEVLNNANAFLADIPFMHTNNQNNYLDSILVVGSDTLYFNIAVDSSNIFNQRPGARMRVKNRNSNLKVVLKVKSIDGSIHFWNVTELTNDVGNWGMPFSYAGTGTTSGDNTYGISEPSCSEDVISVAAYATQYQVSSGAWVGGARASFSSIGPRFDGQMKPDISAPGVAIISSMSSYTDVNFTSMANVDFNGRTYHFAKLSGTSMAAPMVSGIVALMLEANPYLTANQVKEIIQTTAREDNFTGVLSDTGNVMWGRGKINAHLAVKKALETIGIEEIDIKNGVFIYPNPSTSNIHISSSFTLPKVVTILDVSGKSFPLTPENNQLNVAALTPGKYILRFISDGKVFQEAFIKL